MTINELGFILQGMYARLGEDVGKVASIHLFGIRYGKIIKKFNYKPIDIIDIAGLNASYLTELGKGIVLSQYVTINEHVC